MPYRTGGGSAGALECREIHGHKKHYATLAALLDDLHRERTGYCDARRRSRASTL